MGTAGFLRYIVEGATVGFGGIAEGRIMPLDNTVEGAPIPLKRMFVRVKLLFVGMLSAVGMSDGGPFLEALFVEGGAITPKVEPARLN